MRFKHLLITSLLLAPLCASAASLRSFTSDEPVTGPDGTPYRQVLVSCSGRDESIPIWRKESGGEWCGKEAEGFCGRSKIAAGKKVCGSKYRNALEALAASGTAPPASKTTTAAKASEPTTTPEPAVAKTASPADKAEAVAPSPAKDLDEQKEQLAIERERLRVEQERLAIRRQQLELQKEELKLKRELEQAESTQTSAPAPAKPRPAPTATQSEGQGSNVNKNVLGM